MRRATRLTLVLALFTDVNAQPFVTDGSWMDLVLVRFPDSNSVCALVLFLSLSPSSKHPDHDVGGNLACPSGCVASLCPAWTARWCRQLHPYRRVLRPLAKLNPGLLLLSIEDAFGIRWDSLGFVGHRFLLVLCSLVALLLTAVDPLTDAISTIPQMEFIHQSTGE